MNKQRNRLRGLAALLLAIILALCPACAPVTEESSSDASQSSESSEISDSSEESEESSKEESSYPRPETSESEPEIENEVEIPDRSEDIAKQKAKNPDTIGWIEIPNTEVDDAVVQRKGATDNDYYLRKNKNGDYSWYGCYFGDYESVFGPAREDFSRNNIIYAHNLGYTDIPDRPDFSQLFNYLDEDFAEQNPYIFFSTEDENMVWEVFSVFYTEASSWYILVNVSDFAFTNIIKNAKSRSLWLYDVDVTPEDKILTLSTCSYKYGGALNPQRFVVMARLVEKDKPLPATIELEANPNPKEPVF